MIISKVRPSDHLLNLHAVLPVSCVNGPGARAVVWTQGCIQRCRGCCNPLTHSHESRIVIPPKRLAGFILSIPDIEGLTISGGEPFEQAEAVAQLCQAVRNDGLNVMVFTGWTYSFIRESLHPAVRRLLAQIDILIDGPYVQELADSNLLWRGSKNQGIRFLTDCYGPKVLERADTLPQVEANISVGEALGITGFPQPDDINLLARRLDEEHGILLEQDG